MIAKDHRSKYRGQTGEVGKRTLSEKAILSLIGSTIQAQEDILRVGIGDDCAVLHLPGREKPLLLTCDILNEEIHFRQKWITPFLLGYKALTVNQSDIAAMGGHPLVFVVNLSFPPETSVGFIEDFYRGLDLAARRFGGALAGGDLSRSPQGVCLSIAMLGETWGRQPLLRRGARAGDILCLAGWLGLSAVGLQLLSEKAACIQWIENRVRRNSVTRPKTKDQWRVRCIQAHLAPEPMVYLSKWLNRYYIPTAMMDVSDGLSIDLSRFCEASGVGCLVEFIKLPGCPVPVIAPEKQEHAMLHGGEDYALLFTLPPERSGRKLAALQRKSTVPVVPIGIMTKDSGKILLLKNGQEEALPIHGYDHFLKKRGFHDVPGPSRSYSAEQNRGNRRIPGSC